MSEKDNTTHGQSDSFNPYYAATGIEDGQVTRALKALRLLNDAQNPLSLSQALTRARQLAESYARWEESATLIKNIMVCLSDHREIAMEQSKVSSMCGLHIRHAFDPKAVLQIWKRADDQFSEVLLLSLALSGIGRNGYQCEKTYQNGQTLSLKVELCSDEQFPSGWISRRRSR